MSVYPPHAVCWLWDPLLITLHVAGDLATAVAYMGIPAVVVYIARLADAREANIGFPSLRRWSAAFILLCGVVHTLMAAEVYWGGIVLWVSGVVKVALGIVSWGALIAIWRRRAILGFLLSELVGLEKQR